jgi:hypothetical protein
LFSFSLQKLTLSHSFVLKTKEQRAAEKALMDKSPLNTLTLEDFLDSERHKLTGTLTPVNAETFAKWKKERMDKKAAEQEAQKMKEATGRALFEKGDWRDDESGDDDDADDDDDENWNLEAMRRETEAARLRKEEIRLGIDLTSALQITTDSSEGVGDMVEIATEPVGTKVHRQE